MTIDSFREPVTSAAWAPDSASFVIGSNDQHYHLCHWSTSGALLYAWPGPHRVRDVALTADGLRLVAVTENSVRVYDFESRAPLYHITYDAHLTSVALSSDSKYMLLNVVRPGMARLQMRQIDSGWLVRVFRGHHQEGYIIHSTFGGAGDNFVVSGSEGTFFAQL